MKKSELKNLINETVIKVLSEDKHLVSGTRVLYLPFHGPRVLTPGEIVRKHDRGDDWYWIRSRNNQEELLKLGDTAKIGKTFELVKYH